MRAHEFLLEREIKPYDSSVLNIDAAIQQLNQYCSDCLPMFLENPIWRSMNNHKEPFVFIDSSTGERESQNTTNHYTVLMDNSPYFAKFPKRSKSLVGTTALSRARNYSGTTYALFPFNGTKIAQCPKDDIWRTPIDWPAFEDRFNEFADLAEFLAETLYLPPTYEGIVNNVQKNWHVIDRISKYSRKINGVPMVTPETFMEQLLFAMSPKQTGFKLNSIKQYAHSKMKYNTEVWFSGKCIAVEHTALLDIVHAIQEPAKPEAVVKA
jgi:hypothetical protein